MPSYYWWPGSNLAYFLQTPQCIDSQNKTVVKTAGIIAFPVISIFTRALEFTIHLKCAPFSGVVFWKAGNFFFDCVVNFWCDNCKHHWPVAVLYFLYCKMQIAIYDLMAKVYLLFNLLQRFAAFSGFRGGKIIEIFAETRSVIHKHVYCIAQS